MFSIRLDLQNNNEMGKTNKALFNSYLYGILLYTAYGFDIFNYKAIVTP